MEAKVKWRDGVTFVAESGTGHSITMDGPEHTGGKNAGARPMEVLLIGMGGCASYDVIGILQKSRQQIKDCWVELKAQRADAVPAVFTDIHLHFIVVGSDIKPKLVERAVTLSAEKYCSASIMLSSAGVNITHSFEVREENSCAD